MGSRSTKLAVPPHTKAAASPVAPAQQHREKSNNTNESRSCQEHVHRAARATVNMPQPFDNINLNPATEATIASRRRFSEPSQIADMTTEVNADGIRHLDAFESFLVQRDLMSIDIDYTFPISSVPVENLAMPATPSCTLEESREPKEPEEPEEQCIGCCTQLPKKTDPMYAQEVIRPCRSCNSTYCTPCVKDMFIGACKDLTRMPPRCCVPIHLYHIKPRLTASEITEYKSKYEEWSTPKPFYCPKPTCSVFIPERILPPQAGTKGKRKVDSGIGTPTSPNFACPRCEYEICVDCRQVAHPGSLCASLVLGVDAETAALLTAWGYKRCPKCSQGLKRMYGCNHMECRCGAHFCWVCLKSREECDGCCCEDDEENYNSGSEPDEPETFLAQGNNTGIAMAEEQMTTEEATAKTTATSEANSRPRNLDGGSALYWENQDLHFGDEPNEANQDRVWDCYHYFEPYTVSISSLLSQNLSVHEMECVRCWCTVRPEIETPRKGGNVPTKIISYTGSSVTHGGIRRRGTRANGYAHRGRNIARPGRHGRHGNTARLRPAGYVPPRGLFRSNATVGTASHLMASLSPLETSNATLRPEPMEVVRTETDLDAVMNTGETESVSGTWLSEGRKMVPSTSNVFETPAVGYSIALKCENCSLIVCQRCVDDILAQRQAGLEAEAEAEAGINLPDATQELGEAAAPNDHDGQPDPSLCG